MYANRVLNHSLPHGSEAVVNWVRRFLVNSVNCGKMGRAAVIDPVTDLLGAHWRLFFGNAGGDQGLAELGPCKADYVDAAIGARDLAARDGNGRSEERTSELQSLMRNSYAVFCLKKKKNIYTEHNS